MKKRIHNGKQEDAFPINAKDNYDTSIMERKWNNAYAVIEIKECTTDDEYGTKFKNRRFFPIEMELGTIAETK